jgi:HlyD family secretion protein
VNRTRWIFLSLVIVGLAGGAWYYFSGSNTNLPPFVWKTTKIERGDINSVITATGTLQALNTVQVGTQVSGTVAKLYVDFNDFVRAGQIVAQLDTALLAASVLDANAALTRNQVSARQAKNDFERGKLLFAEKVIAQVEMDNLMFAWQTAESNVRAAQAGLNRALVNLKFATITAPISGVVISRAVDVGQTVAASFNTPTLFSIAADLTKMQVQANVDEADIGQVHEGQNVNFTVEAFPNKTFKGVVTQKRLQPTTTTNVVNYTVIVSVSNPEKLLMPGMTATLTFDVAQRKSVLRVPNSALRFRPPGEFYEHFGKSKPDSTKGKPNSGVAKTEQKTDDSLPSDAYLGRLWLVRKGSNLAFMRVKVGLTDGTYSEILGLAGPSSDSLRIAEGVEVAVALEKSNIKAKGSSPFSFKFGQPQQRRTSGTSGGGSR